MKKREQINNSAKIADKLKEYSATPIYAVLNKMKSRQRGFDDFDIMLLQEEYEPNEISREKPKPWYVLLFNSFVNPFTVVLMLLALVSFFTDVVYAAEGEKNFITIIVISIMVTISGGLRYIQERKSSKEAENLKSLVKTTCTVSRNSQKQEIDMRDLLPGDIVLLSAGDMIPADLMVISSKDLFVSQSSMTGESEPVEKYTVDKNPGDDKSIFDLQNICFMGTDVVSGSARCVVLTTGDNTYFGAMAKSLAGERGQTSFDRGVNSVSWLLIRYMLVMVPIVFFLNGFAKGDWLSALLFAISIAVGLTPEMLPMIVTTNLAKGAVRMAKRKTVVKRLNAIQNFGAMNILCTDKTGTLTHDEIVIERHLNVAGEEDIRVLRHAYLNSFFQTGMKNLIDLAVIERGAENNFSYLNGMYTKVDEIPFDFSRRCMSVVLKEKSGKTQLITKGAVEEMLAICSYAELHGETVPLTEEIRQQVMKMSSDLNSDGMRVIAVAQKNNPSSEGAFGVKDESDMTLMGCLGLLDPPKESAAEAIKALNEYGVTIKILTGDNEIVAKKICRDVGLDVSNTLLGFQVENMNDEELKDEVDQTTIFAKLSPMQKARVVKALQENGHTVGYMGDGINDAAALTQSDVGISVDTAVDIAKESADIILLEKDLMVLEEGVIEGRKIFGNIIKYIKMTASSNFGNMLSVLFASVFLPFLPMLPIQILVLNLLYDISQISIPWDNMDPSYLKKPRQWDASGISRFMIWIGPISSVFDIATYLLMWFVFGASSYVVGAVTNSNAEVMALFHSGWFVESLISQTLIVHLIRTKKIPFIQSRASKPVLLLTTIIVLIGFAIPFSPLGVYLKLAPLPLEYFPWLAAIIVSYFVLAQIMKAIYIKVYKSWL